MGAWIMPQTEKEEVSPELNFEEEEQPPSKELGGLDFSLGGSDDEEEQKTENPKKITSKPYFGSLMGRRSDKLNEQMDHLFVLG